MKKTLLSLSLVTLLAPGSALALNQTFTYQGVLKNGAAPALDGFYDLRFQLYEHLSSYIPPAPGRAESLQIRVPVTNGLFTVLLSFTGAPLDGRDYWIELAAKTNGAPTYEILAPRQSITAAPYAIYSMTAGGITGTLPAAQLPANVALLDRAQLFTASQTFQARTLFNNLVGIGTASPQQALHVNGAFARVDGLGNEQAYLGGDGAGGDVQVGSFNPAVNALALWNAGNSTYMNLYANDINLSGDLTFGNANGSIIFPATSGANAPMIHLFASGTGNANRMVLSHSPTYPNYGLQYQDATDRFVFLGAGLPVLSVALGSGNVGIGMDNPQVPLDVLDFQASSRFTSSDSINGSVLTLRNTTPAPTYLGAINFENAGDTPGQLGYFANHRFGFRVAGVERMTLDGAGNLAYGGQLNKLDVADNFESVVRAADFKLGFSGRRGSPGRALVDFTDTLYLNFASDWAHTFIGGDNVSVCSLSIRGGCDLAEPFPISEAANDIPKGAVVVIDDQNPGHLKMSDRACDTRVAGIVSGANGVNTGVTLKQEGVFENGQNIALSGRVYVQAVADGAPIRPGDLLTTSDLPGHAMRVTDPAKATGAILGKAMTPLADGRGMVLVLVSLQ